MTAKVDETRAVVESVQSTLTELGKGTSLLIPNFIKLCQGEKYIKILHLSFESLRNRKDSVDLFAFPFFVARRRILGFGLGGYPSHAGFPGPLYLSSRHRTAINFRAERHPSHAKRIARQKAASRCCKLGVPEQTIRIDAK